MGRKRRRAAAPEMHSKNKYKDAPPDFSLLGSLYPSFLPYLIFPNGPNRPTIDFTDFSATRELTRVLLLHDHGVNWWIPDGQLCPTIPNRSNYIHWIEDLLASDLIPSNNTDDSDQVVRGFDIGTGANCIYPLLGASLLGWSFVGSDITPVALEWAKKNVESNPHISHLIEIRVASNSEPSNEASGKSDPSDEASGKSEPSDQSSGKSEPSDKAPNKSEPSNASSCINPILVGVVREGERFDFCMCNPPFFESLTDAGLNPKTACGGTHEEMVCEGGEREFVGRIVEDSVRLKDSFRWFTSMVGRKANLKFLMSKIRENGATIVKTTEFVQGHTARWGLAWSFLSPKKTFISPNLPIRTNLSFMLEGLERKKGAFQVLKFVEASFLSSGALCKSDMSSFCVNVTISDGPSFTDCSEKKELSFRISVFEQIPGTVLVKGSLLQKDSSLAGDFARHFSQLEEKLKMEFFTNPRTHK